MPRGRPAAVAAIPTWSGRPLPHLPPPPRPAGPPVAARPSQSASSCPGRGNEPPGAAAPACRPAVWPASMFHFHPGVGQHAMGRPLFRLAGQDLRKRPVGTLLPRSAHLHRTPPNPSVRVHAACVLAPGPFGIGPPDLAGHRTGPARRTTRPADRRPAPVRLRRPVRTARRIPERRPDVGSGQRRRRAARQLHPPSTPVKVQTGAGRARWRASRSSAIRSVAGGGTRDASPCTRTEGRLGKRWLRTARSGFAIRASADQPTALSRGPTWQPAAAKQMPTGLPCADDTTGTASGRRGPGASPRDDGFPSSIPSLARRRRRPDPARPRRCRASRRPGGCAERRAPGAAAAAAGGSETPTRSASLSGMPRAESGLGFPVVSCQRSRLHSSRASDVRERPPSTQAALNHSTVSVGKCRSPTCMPCCVARN